MNDRTTRAVVFLLFAFPAFHAILAQNVRKCEAAYSGEAALRVTMGGGYGSVLIRRTGGEKLYVLTEKNGSDESMHAAVAYRVKSGSGHLKINLNDQDEDERNMLESLSCFVKGKTPGEWVLELTDRIPINLTFELGAGDAKLDLSGLKIAGLCLETGASSMNVMVSERNLAELRSVDISAGVGSITTKGLGNLNFERLTFEGGLGSYQLDLTGDIRNDARISADLGMGSLVIVLPKGIEARLKSDDSFLSSTHYHRFIRMDDDRYETSAYGKANRRVSIDIDSGIGSVSIKWKD